MSVPQLGEVGEDWRQPWQGRRATSTVSTGSVMVRGGRKWDLVFSS